MLPCIYEKYEKYLALYHQFYDFKITNKNYETTLIRWLIIFFLYRENEFGNKITMKELANLFLLKNETTISHSNKKIRLYVKNPDKIHFLVGKNKTIFFYFYYRCNKIFFGKE